MTMFKHLKALLHKNLLYMRRQWCLSIFEIIVPCLLMILMAIIRKEVKLIEYPPQNFEDTFVIVDTQEISDPVYMHYPLTYDPN